MSTNTGQVPALYTTAASVPAGPPQYSMQQPNYGPDQKYDQPQQPQQQQQQNFGGQQFGGMAPPPAAASQQQQQQQQFQQAYPGHPGMGQGYYPPVMVVQPQPAPVIYAQQPMFVQQFPMSMGIGGLSTAPGLIDCPRCGKRGLTNTSLVVGSRTHLWAFLFCIFLGIGCIPYLMDSLKDVEHHCSSCGALLTTYRR